MRLAVVFEEVAAYEYRKNKELEQQQASSRAGPGSTKQVGLEPDFEEDFSFGAEDDNDYLHGTECWDCEDPHELQTAS